jgi:thioredoxin 1
MALSIIFFTFSLVCGKLIQRAITLMNAGEKPDWQELTREAVGRMKGLVLLEFGASWCPFCQALQVPLAELLQAHPEIKNLKIEDGRGKLLGRSFQVKLWPNLVFLRDGIVLKQLARPSQYELQAAFQEIASGLSRDA